MKNFEHVNATSIDRAIILLGMGTDIRPIAGGTDLLAQMKSGAIAPNRLVNLKTIPDLDSIRFDIAGGLRLGALATLTSVIQHEVVRTRYPLLAEAISLAASPQLRNRGTIGGNLLQDSRCWYFRGDFNCWLKGGELCFAKDGENANHAIMDGGPCYTVHPSDPAPALIALGAEARISGPRGERTTPVERLFQRPRGDDRRLTVLGPDEIITEIAISTPSQDSRGTYLKAMDRKVWAFALASVAAQITFDGNIVRDARIVLGGVAPVPWRASDAEASLRGRMLDEASISSAADRAVASARPLSNNDYKIPLVKGIIIQALMALRS